MGLFSWVKRNLGGIGGAVLGTLIAPGIGTALGAGLGSKTVDNKSWQNSLVSAGLGGLGGLGLAGLGGGGAVEAGSLAGSAGVGGASSLSPVGLSGLEIGSLAGPAGLGGASLLNPVTSSQAGALAGSAGLGGASLLNPIGPEVGALAAPAGLGGASLLKPVTTMGAGAFAGPAGMGGASLLNSVSPAASKFSLGGLLNNPYVIGGALGLDYYSKKKQEEAMKKASKQYLQDATWTPENRSKYVSGLQGLISEQVGAAKKRAASSGAESGRGGGSYGKAVQDARRQGNEMAARLLAETYQPQNTNLNAYTMQNSDATSSWLDDILGLAGRYYGNQLAPAFTGV